MKMLDVTMYDYVVSYDLKKIKGKERDYDAVDEVLKETFKAKRRLQSVWRFKSSKDFDTICKELRDALGIVLRTGDKVDVFLVTKVRRAFPVGKTRNR